MIEYDAKWAYWIDLATFLIHKAKGQVPIGSVVITKKQERLDDGRRVVQTTYAIATKDGLSSRTKREISAMLPKYMITYMRNSGEFPPYTDIKDVLANGNVNIVYEPKRVERFIIRLTEEIVGEDVEMFLNQLSMPEMDEPEPWKVEPAKSSRATCRSCGQKIMKGELRIGEPSFYEGHVSYKWHHLQCGAYLVKGKNPTEIIGFDQLNEEQQREFKAAIE